MAQIYPEESKKLDLIGHLEELRRRVLYSLGALAAAAAALFWSGDLLMNIVTRPVRGLVDKLIFISPTEAFTAYIKVALLGGILIVFPFITYQIWAFLAPAFPRKFRPRIALWLSLALALFFSGFAFSYFIAVPTALRFLMNFGREAAEPNITLGRYVSFFGAMELVGGIVFMIPVVLGLLSDIGLVQAAALRKKRPHAIVAIMIFAAILTPTQDIVNMLMFALPMVILYEAGILLAACLERRRQPV